MITRYKKQQTKRKFRVRHKIKTTTTRPRLSVFRSNKHIYAQIIDHNSGKTIVSARETDLPKKSTAKLNKREKAKMVGEKLAQLAKAKKITKVVFDRGPYKYHGRIKALAEAARSGGLNF